jgi:anaerobic glycerol-3-phosphate dehydrogenase
MLPQPPLLSQLNNKVQGALLKLPTWPQIQALLNANAALQAQFNQLNAGAAAGAAIIIADTPGSYDINSPLDYSSKSCFTTRQPNP